MESGQDTGLFTAQPASPTSAASLSHSAAALGAGGSDRPRGLCRWPAAPCRNTPSPPRGTSPEGLQWPHFPPLNIFSVLNPTEPEMARFTTCFLTTNAPGIIYPNCSADSHGKHRPGAAEPSRCSEKRRAANLANPVPTGTQSLWQRSQHTPAGRKAGFPSAPASTSSRAGRLADGSLPRGERKRASF